MNFVYLKENEFINFSKNHMNASFFQTVGWGKLKSKTGWKYYLVGIKKNNNIIAGAMILEKKLIGSKTILYSPRGLLLDYNDKELLSFFTMELKKFAREKKAVFLKIDPYVILHERDKDGTILDEENDKTNYEIINNIKSVGFRHLGFNLEQDNRLQARWMFVAKTIDKSMDDIKNDMSKSVKRIINKNEKLGIYVEETNKEGIKEFVSVMESTANRKKFSTRTQKYYTDMYECLKEEDIFHIYLIKANFKSMLANLKSEKKSVMDIKEQQIKKEQDGFISNYDKYEKEINSYDISIDSLTKQIEEAEKNKKQYGDIVTLGAVLYMVYGNEILGLYGGAYKEFINYSPFYSIHNYMLNKCINEHYKRYNYYAISGNLSKDDPLYSIYQVKRSFGGQIIELIGEFDLIFNKPLYYLYNFGYGIMIKTKMFINKFRKND